MKRWFPSRETIMRSRWLAPLANHLEDDRLWHMERGSVARAAAIGLFFGLLLPTGQFILAVAFAVWLRAHVAVAAGATLITNPLTFAPVYWLAYRVGSALLGRTTRDADVGAAAVEAQTEATAASQGWIAAMWEAVQNAGAPLIVGLAVMAVVCAAIGFALVWFLWPRHLPRQDEKPRLLK